jgi:hypothetical protein
MGTEEELFTTLNRDLTPKHAKKWARGEVEDWAEQSHKAGQKTVYGKLPAAPPGGQIAVDARYEQIAGPLIKDQIEKAGIRLATVLNATLK